MEYTTVETFPSFEHTSRSYTSIRPYLNYYYELNSRFLRIKYREFTVKKPGVGSFLLIAALMNICALFPAQLVAIFDDIHAVDDHSNQVKFAFRFFTSVVGCISVLIAGVMACLLYLHHQGFSIFYQYTFLLRLLTPFHQTTTDHHNSTILSPSVVPMKGGKIIPIPESSEGNLALSVTKKPKYESSSSNKASPLSSTPSQASSSSSLHSQYIQETEERIAHAIFNANNCLVIFIQIYFICIFFRRCLGLNCILNTNSILKNFGGGRCYSGELLSQVIVINSLMMISLPVFLLINLPIVSIRTVWGSFIMSVISTVIIAIALNRLGVFAYLALWIVLCCFTIMDIQIRNLLSFFAKLDLNKALLNNKKMEEEYRAHEMRSMIGNIAHDMKTPLSSFLAGVDFIQHVLSEFQNKVASSPTSRPFVNHVASYAQDLIESIQSCLISIRNTNAFMLMTINRCIDYAKASKGIALMPRQETIDLKDVIQIPITCMQNMQNRIDVRLKFLDKEIAQYVITDRQWLLENVLCLLSNAVKYTHTGGASIQVILREGDELRGFRRDSTHQFFMKDKTSSRWETNLRKPEGNFIVVEVEDTGVGIPKEKMDIIFQPFEQSKRIIGGTGLGLYCLAKRIEALGGFYGAQGRKDGEMGTLVWFAIPYEEDQYPMHMSIKASTALPLKPSLPAATSTTAAVSSTTTTTTATRSTKEIVTSVKETIQIELVSTMSEKTSPFATSNFILGNNKISEGDSGKMLDECKADMTPPEEAGKQQHVRNTSFLVATSSFSKPSVHTNNYRYHLLDILIVDDSPSILKMTSMILKKLGHIVTTAENGEVALRMMTERWKRQQSQFDVILMDLQMPVMDGLESTRRIREFEIEEEKRLYDLERELKTRMHELETNGFAAGNHRHAKDELMNLNDIKSLEEEKEQVEHDLQRCMLMLKNFHHQVIIGMSANSDHDTSEEAMQAGVDTFLAKPFSATTFTDTAKNVLIQHGHFTSSV